MGKLCEKYVLAYYNANEGGTRGHARRVLDAINTTNAARVRQCVSDFEATSQSSDDKATEANRNLLASGAKLEVTQEQGAVKVPTGTVILTGSFPPQAFAHVQHLLVSYPDTPRKIGLLVGTLEQTHLLGIQAAVLQSATTSHNTVAIGCIAQSLIDIIEGKHGSHYQPLDATCMQQDVTATGDRFGLLTKGGYLTGAAEHASLAISQPDATSAIFPR